MKQRRAGGKGNGKAVVAIAIIVVILALSAIFISSNGLQTAFDLAGLAPTLPFALPANVSVLSATGGQPNVYLILLDNGAARIGPSQVWLPVNYSNQAFVAQSLEQNNATLANLTNQQNYFNQNYASSCGSGCGGVKTGFLEMLQVVASANSYIATQTALHNPPAQAPPQNTTTTTTSTIPPGCGGLLQPTCPTTTISQSPTTTTPQTQIPSSSGSDLILEVLGAIVGIIVVGGIIFLLIKGRSRRVRG